MGGWNAKNSILNPQREKGESEMAQNTITRKMKYPLCRQYFRLTIPCFKGNFVKKNYLMYTIHKNE